MVVFLFSYAIIQIINSFLAKYLGYFTQYTVKFLHFTRLSL